MTGPANNDLQINVDIQAVEQVLLRACAAAAEVSLPLFRTDPAVDNKDKAAFDPVTIADKNAELAIRDVIAETFPDHAIIGEEHATKQTGSDFSWIIDPIDGTRAFISGLPVWGTLIGVAHEGRVFAGAMSQPFIGETFLGLPGASTYQREGQRQSIRTSQITRLEQAKLFTTTPQLFEGKQRKAFNRLEQKIMLPRYGCDCYAYCLLASGHCDLVVEPRLNTYDIAALIPIVREAGGVVTCFDGSAPDQGGDIIAAATPELHAAAMKIMQG